MITPSQAGRIAAIVIPSKNTVEDLLKVRSLGEEFSVGELESAAAKTAGCGSIELFEATLRGSHPGDPTTWGVVATAPSESKGGVPSGVDTLEALMNWQEPLEGFSPDKIWRSLRYHMQHNSRPWFREHMNESFLRRNIRVMIAETPVAFEVVIGKAGKSVFTDFKKLAWDEMLGQRSSCQECHGTGEVPATLVPGKKKCPTCLDKWLEIFNRMIKA